MLSKIKLPHSVSSSQGFLLMGLQPEHCIAVTDSEVTGGARTRIQAGALRALCAPCPLPVVPVHPLQLQLSNLRPAMHSGSHLHAIAWVTTCQPIARGRGLLFWWAPARQRKHECGCHRQCSTWTLSTHMFPGTALQSLHTGTAQAEHSERSRQMCAAPERAPVAVIESSRRPDGSARSVASLPAQC